MINTLWLISHSRTKDEIPYRNIRAGSGNHVSGLSPVAKLRWYSRLTANAAATYN
ncbi:hypothetical protein LJR289_001990 [Pseudoduganella sp. LjRoot289]|uniref:hypothetical protein n=1 Tax=Pseudoduganella sp. LjRoot289 TaxID=3342314 RepID=UPI003ED128E2